jgi:hypothetical protein
MSSNYTGNPAGVQSPATAPAVNNPPIAVLPSDGDADSAASVAQAFKVLADNSAFALDVLGGTLTAKTLQTDGTGGGSVTASTGDVVASGRVLSSTAYSKSIWYPVGNWQIVSGTWSNTGSAMTMGCTSDGELRCGFYMPYDDASARTTTIIALEVITFKTTSSPLTITLWSTNPATLADTSIATATTSLTGYQILLLSSLTAAASGSAYYWLEVDVKATDRVGLMNVEYTSQVF